MEEMRLASSAFKNEENIPIKYTCDGENISPELIFENVPVETKSLTLLMKDPDVPKSIREDGMWNHWVVFNIPSDTRGTGEGQEPEGTHGITTSNKLGYGGPCPPDREHRYFFKLFALDTELVEQEGATKEDIESAMQEHILATAELMGRYERSS